MNSLLLMKTTLPWYSGLQLLPSYIYDPCTRYSAQDVARAKSLPKVELHLHLDGSLSPQFIARRALIRGIQLPTSPERLRSFLMDKKLEKLKKDNNRVEDGGNC